MKTIAIANAAGSAGKTTSVVTLAALLAPTQRVMVVDLDPQANATQWLGVEEPHTLSLTVGDVLLDQCSATEAVVETNTAGVSLLPAAPRLNTDVLNLSQAVNREGRLANALEGLDADVVLIDCPGQLGVMTYNAIVAADHVVTVTQPTRKELEGIAEIHKTVRTFANAFRSGVSLAAIIPCIVPPASAGLAYSEGLEMARDSYGELVTSPVRRSVKVVSAYAASEPLPAFAAGDPVTKDYEAVLADLQRMGVL